jgi:hypothetical protein
LLAGEDEVKLGAGGRTSETCHLPLHESVYVRVVDQVHIGGIDAAIVVESAGGARGVADEVVAATYSGEQHVVS